jgi:pimeloyl-ACP methyl ester carboxylesterase
MNKRAAYFELRADYFGRQFDDGILQALLLAGYDVDVYAPGGAQPQTLYPPERVRRLDVEYRRAWLTRQTRPAHWRQYDLFLGTPDLPVAFAGWLAKIAGRPVVTACDEIFVGGYEGDARGPWKKLAQWAMRRSAFTILTDLVRVPLQREYAHLPVSHEFVPYPCCYPDPFTGLGERDALRATLGIDKDDFVLSIAGGFHAGNGADWAVRLLDRVEATLLIQPGGPPDPVTDALLRNLAAQGRAIYLPERVSWREATRLTSAADLGLVFYLSPKAQFQHMGISSQKLCTSLYLGIPAVATRQPSFDFLEQFGCGVLVSSEVEVPAAIARIRREWETFSRNALRAVDEYVRPTEKLRALAERFRSMG